MLKPSKHEVIHLLLFKNIQLRNSQQNLNLKSTNPTKTRNFLCVSTNTDINKLNWRFKSYIFSDHKPGLLLYGIVGIHFKFSCLFSCDIRKINCDLLSKLTKLGTSLSIMLKR